MNYPEEEERARFPILARNVIRTRYEISVFSFPHKRKSPCQKYEGV
jgi:hypothetical protein